MAEFIRPEIRAAARRWREVGAAIAVTALGLYWALASFGLLRWVGIALALAGVAAGLAALQRLRFNRGGGGPGIVAVDEGRIAYMGPLTGGMADLGRLRRLELEPEALPAPHWILTSHDDGRLEIPVNAEGAEALFDAFAALPGIRVEYMLSVLRRTPAARVTIWEAPARRLH